MSTYSDKIKNDYKKNPFKAIDQLEWCNYENEAGILKNNIAWIAIKEIFQERKNICKQCGDEYFDSGNDGYCSKECFEECISKHLKYLLNNIKYKE